MGFNISNNANVTAADGLSRIMDTEHVVEFVDLLNFWTYSVNMVNGVFAFLLVLTWCLTKSGDRGMWIKARLFNACSMLGSIFIVLAAVIFTTYFDDLVVLKINTGY